MIRLPISTALCLPLLILGAACSSPASPKGEESPMPAADGKSDTWWAPTHHGELRFGEESRGVFDGAAGEHKFHAWDFELGGVADVNLTTTPIDLNVDTVAYLYRWGEAERSWGSYLARNDDHAGSIGSQIARQLEAGAYRLVIKGYKDTVEGAFSLLGTCAGAGCPAAAPANDLTAEEAASVVTALDNVCGDTYCGGDFDWWTVSAVCVFGTGCTITFDARSYYPEDAFPADWLAQFPADRLTRTGTTLEGGHPYLVEVESIVDRASEGNWARATCELAVPYAGIADLVDESSPGAWPAPTFSDQIMDCVGSIEEVLFSILPSTVNP